MPAINHSFAEQNTAQSTTSSTFGDVSGCSIADTEFEAGKKYLIWMTWQTWINDGVTSINFRVLHGSTSFADSEYILSNSGTNRTSHLWFTVWEAVSGEGIKLQFANGDNATQINCNFVAMTSICLSDDVTEGTDWHFDEDAADLGLTTTPQAGASITFTEAGDWLIAALSFIDRGDTTTQSLSRINRSGEASSTDPSAGFETAGAGHNGEIPTVRVYSLGAVSNTFTEESSASSGTAHTRLHSKIFALKLDKFRNHAFTYTAADISLSATDYGTNLKSATITPDVLGDVWMLAWWGFDKNNASRLAEFRVQLDDADQPAGQTTANYPFSIKGEAANEEPMCLSTLVSLSAAAHTFDLDASVDSTTGTPAGQYRLVMAVTMELAVVTPDTEELFAGARSVGVSAIAGMP